MTDDRRKLTPAQRAALQLLDKIGPDAIARRAAYLGNRTHQPAPFCAVIHAGTAENLNRRGLVRIVYPPHILANTLEITDAGRRKLAPEREAAKAVAQQRREVIA